MSEEKTIEQSEIIDEIQEIKSLFQQDAGSLIDNIWGRKIEEMSHEKIDRDKRQSFNRYKDELNEVRDGIESDFLSIQDKTNFLLNMLAQKADFDNELETAINLGFLGKDIKIPPINERIPIVIQKTIFDVIGVFTRMITDLTVAYQRISEVEELFDDVKGLYELKKKVSKMSMDYFYLRERIDSGNKEILDKSNALNARTSLLASKIDDYRAKYYHKKLSREICVSIIQKALKAYNKTYDGPIQKIIRSDSYWRDMLSGWNTYLRKDGANGEKHKPFPGYVDKIFGSSEDFYNWALSEFIPHIYKLEETKEAKAKEKENLKNIAYDTQYEENNRKGRRVITGSREPLNNALPLRDEDVDASRGEDNDNYIAEESDYQFDETQDLSNKEKAKIVAKRLRYSGSVKDFCKDNKYAEETVWGCCELAADNLDQLI